MLQIPRFHEDSGISAQKHAAKRVIRKVLWRKELRAGFSGGEAFARGMDWEGQDIRASNRAFGDCRPLSVNRAKLPTNRQGSTAAS
jgi:hypothetical protein